MKIKNEFPPNFIKIRETFKSYIFDNSQTIYAYWPDIYNPDGIIIPQDLLVHEITHLERQNGNPKEWWNKYLADSNFRLEEEVAAYQEQYQFIKKIIKDRNKLARGLMNMARCLASPMYGNILDLNESIKKIENAW